MSGRILDTQKISTLILGRRLIEIQSSLQLVGSFGRSDGPCPAVSRSRALSRRFYNDMVFDNAYYDEKVFVIQLSLEIEEGKRHAS